MKKFWQMREQGSILIFEIIVIFIFSLVMMAVLSNAVQQFRVTRSTVYREQAFAVAEAGINYYQWHLAKFPVDFQNGTGAAPTTHAPFPNACYVQTYVDKDLGTNVGQFCLEITPPATGSTIATVKSTGYVYGDPQIMRSVTARFGVPSLAKYGFLTNSEVWIGDTETVNGAMHSNNGIHFDGTGNAPITSAKTTYTCSSWAALSGCPATKNGIWGSATQSTKNFWQYPVPSVDFSSITANFSTIKTDASASGIYLSPSNAQGYSLVFNNDGTVSIYKVTSTRATGQTGYDVNGASHNEALDYNTRVLQSTSNIPANGLLYIEDRVWVEGTVNGRVTVAAAKLPYNASTAPSIIVPNNLVYNTKDGSSVLGLLAQKDILASYFAPNNLEIDAAIIAQTGSVQFYYYPGNIKTSIIVYGSLGSYGVWTWSWVNGSGSTVSGFPNTTTTYDPNLLYGPPPSFPLSSSGYQQISWSSN